ncbi:MAG: oligosaccharide flippase family protein [Flavobacteriales bacterium]|nr:oligosaccharide flippase family protein [Flavobacteriales bacterium]
MGRIARQATINSLLTYVGLVLGFVNLVLLYPRILTPGELGLTRLVVSIAVIAAQIAQVGLESTTIRYFPYFRERRGGHHGFYAVVLLLGTLGGLLAMLALWLFHGTFTQWFGDKEGLYGEFGLIVVPMVLAEVWYILFAGSAGPYTAVSPRCWHMNSCCVYCRRC